MATSLSTSFLKQVADDHLRQIRKRKGVDDSEGQHFDNVGDLNRALNILSDQLYKKATHFLLELIQNADDNSFDNDIPTISFHLNISGSAWEMRIDCNEVGFEKENVEALCRIGDSTKKDSDRTKGYIGEKGIGFKSVFKVADVVHISSKAYSFRFDRRGMLGMIAPIIETFPSAHLIAGQTQMLLELYGESEFRGIRDELQKLEPQILIFLRKISKLVIHTPDQHFQFEIRRVIEDLDLDGKETVTLTITSLPENKKTDKKYVIVRRYETSLPKEDRRENVKETEIVLAFPIDENMRPLLLQHQHTYAYLPIDDYGFNYLIQGDFLLVANRESLDSSKWNDSVLEGVYRAFVFRAVPRFNEFRGSSPLFQGLRYTWPLFLKDRGGAYEFWSRLKRWIFIRLATEDVLESRHNRKLSHPESLLYIPSEFRLEGKPLVEDENSELHHLSFLYDSEIDNILPELKRMGVKVMQFLDFYKELNILIAKPGNLFLKSQSNQWHSKIADLFRRHSSKSQVANIPLIPLRDGRWVTPSQSHLFLEGDTSDAVVPGGIDICLVDAEACQDVNRKAFFQWLGIKTCDQAEVCRMIMECYTPFRSRTLTNSVHDLIYLFQTPPNVYNGSIGQLQLVSARPIGANFMNAKGLYIEYPGKESIISKYARDPASNMPLLHPMYIEEVRKLKRESEFVGWVCSRLKVSTQPRLINEQQLLTPEFNFLKTNAAKDLLLLLRDHWDKYASQLDSHQSKSSKLKTAVSEMNVDCTDGLSRPLDKTVLPLGALKVAGPNLPFIDIPEPNDPRWLKFSTFGVLTDLSTGFYLRQLKALAALPVTDSTSKLAVRAVYTGLESSIVLYSTETQIDFELYPLIFHEGLKRWVFLRDCVWSGPKLSSVHNLSSEYPQYKKLFRSYLHLGNVTHDHVTKELQCATSSTSFDRLEELLLLLNKHLKLGAPQDCMSKLKGKKIIPVIKPDGKLYCLSYNEDLWYFVDRQSLWDSFSGKLPLISFDVRTVRTLKPLMGLTRYLLSVADKPTLEIVGDQIYDEEKTWELRERARYFLPLVTEETAETKAQLLARLKTLKVWGVPAIKLNHEVDGVSGAEDTGNVIFDDADDGKLEIYLSFNDSRKAIIDFQLSEKFIRYCGITDHSFQMLVAPILTYSLDDIEEFLEGYGLDQPSDHLDRSADIPESVSERKDDADTITSPRTPSSGTNILYRESGLEVSGPSSFLRDRIPALDQSISSVRIAAALPSMTPTLVITPSQSRTNPTHSTPGTSSDAKDIKYPRAGNELLSAGVGIDQAKQSTTSATEHESETSHDAFEFGDFHSTFSEVFRIETPSRNSRRSSTQHPSVPRFSQSPRTPTMEPDPDSTMQGIHLQHIGLLGETFVNDWLSRHLENDWDATRHWTSRNRNYVYADHPFTGSEKDYADFTYPDANKNLTNLLIKYGFIRNVETWSTNPPTYHLEVKSTPEPCNEPFYMSNNQVDKARQYSISWDSDTVPENVYVVIRVYNLEKEIEPGFTAYVDPWAMYLRNELSFLARENYAVTPNVHRD